MSNTAAKMVMPIKNEVFLYLGGLCTSCRYPGEISGANSSSNDCFFLCRPYVPTFLFIILYVTRKNMHKENSRFIISGCFVLYIFVVLERDG